MFPSLELPRPLNIRRSNKTNTTYLRGLTSAYRCAEHVGIKAIIVPKLKLRDIERHVFGAHFVERANCGNFSHPHTGKLSCLRGGSSTVLPRSIAKARAMRGRVACGMITSSI